MNAPQKIIYWIDKHPVFNSLVNPQILSLNGAQVIAFNSWQQAQIQFKIQKPDLLITEVYNTENENFFASLNSFQKRFSQIPIILLTENLLPWLFVCLHRYHIFNISIINKNEEINLNNIYRDILQGKQYKNADTADLENSFYRDKVFLKIAELNETHWQALFCFSQAMSDVQTSKCLKLSVHTVNDIRKKIYQTTACTRKTCLIQLLFRIGFYSIERSKTPKIRG